MSLHLVPLTARMHGVAFSRSKEFYRGPPAPAVSPEIQRPIGRKQSGIVKSPSMDTALSMNAVVPRWCGWSDWVDVSLFVQIHLHPGTPGGWRHSFKRGEYTSPWHQKNARDRACRRSVLRHLLGEGIEYTEHRLPCTYIMRTKEAAVQTAGRVDECLCNRQPGQTNLQIALPHLASPLVVLRAFQVAP